MARKKGLGQGLSALIPSTQVEPLVDGRGIDVLVPDRRQAKAGTKYATGSKSPAVRVSASVTAPTSNPVHDLLSPGKQASTSRSRGAGAKGGKAGGIQVNLGGQDTSTSGSDDEALVEVPGATFAQIRLDDIIPNTRQPRQVFDDDELGELAASIAEVGVLQPVVVRRANQSLTGDAHFELIMGERRWRASKLAGQETVPAIVRHTDEVDLLRDALLENLHRANLNPLEEAAAYQQLLDDFSCTQEVLAKRIARSRPQISNTLRLLKLPPLVQSKVAAGVLSAGHARALLGLGSSEQMEVLANRIVAEGLSVRSTEEMVALSHDNDLVKPASSPSKATPKTSPQTETLLQELGDFLDTRVRLQMGRVRGKLIVEFAGQDDLERIINRITPNASSLS